MRRSPHETRAVQISCSDASGQENRNRVHATGVTIRHGVPFALIAGALMPLVSWAHGPGSAIERHFGHSFSGQPTGQFAASDSSPEFTVLLLESQFRAIADGLSSAARSSSGHPRSTRSAENCSSSRRGSTNGPELLRSQPSRSSYRPATRSKRRSRTDTPIVHAARSKTPIRRFAPSGSSTRSSRRLPNASREAAPLDERVAKHLSCGTVGSDGYAQDGAMRKPR